MTLEEMINKIPIKIKKLHPDAKVPTYGTENAAGFDIYSVEDHTLQPGETYAVHSGIALEIPKGKAVFIWDRSGMGFKGIHRFAGLLDSDYRGEYNIIICNHTKEPYEVKKGDRIAQGVIQDYYKAEFEEVEELGDSERGKKWNNSTGQ
jgi:dUTP pyrophosphatase